jgi:hypothetical protein
VTFFDSFIPQLLATLVGGAIGVFGVWWAFRLQRKAATRDGVEHAVENLLLRLAEYVGLVDAYTKEFDMMQWHVYGAKMQRTYPHAAPVSIAVELLRMRTVGQERAVADAFAATWNIVAHAPAQTAASAAGHMATAVSLWRLEAPEAEINNSLSFAAKLSRSEGDDAPGQS